MRVLQSSKEKSKKLSNGRVETIKSLLRWAVYLNQTSVHRTTVQSSFLLLIQSNKIRRQVGQPQQVCMHLPCSALQPHRPYGEAALGDLFSGLLVDSVHLYQVQLCFSRSQHHIHWAQTGLSAKWPCSPDPGLEWWPFLLSFIGSTWVRSTGGNFSLNLNCHSGLLQEKLCLLGFFMIS